MGKFKGIVIILLVVVGGVAGAVFGLNRVLEKELTESIHRLQQATPAVQQLLRSLAFDDIRQVAGQARNEQLAPLALSAPRLAPTTAANEAASALNDYSARALPVLEKLGKQLPQRQLALVTKDGLVAAATGKSLERGASLKGLPVIEHCLSGLAGDGWYNLQDSVQLLAAAPVPGAGGTVAACLATFRPVTAGLLSRWSKPLGLEAALASEGKLVATTLEDNDLLKPVLSKPAGDDKPQLLGQAGQAPLLARQPAALAVSSVKLPAGNQALALLLVRDLRPISLRAAGWQKQVFMGAGALFILGLLLALVLGGSKLNRQLARLSDAARLVAEGGASATDFDSFSGPLAELAGAIRTLAEHNGRTAAANGTAAMAAATADFAPRPEPVQPAAPKSAEPESEPATLDFESLLEQAEQPEPPAAAAEPAAPPPAEPPALEPAAPAPPAQVEPPPAPAAPAGAGPRVELPGDLANIFGEGEETREVDTSLQQQALRESVATDLPPPPPLSEQPAAPAAPPDFDDGDEPEAGEYRSDATVIAEVPSELISLAQKTSGESPEAAPRQEIPPPPAPIPAPPVVSTPSIPPPPVASPPTPAAAAAGEEEQHFRQVFEQFLETKKQCGEQVGNLSFEKFAQKLSKNSSDLKARYGCRTVKFQVYVKNGKAALKATPVK